MRSINSFELPQLLLSSEFFRHCLKTPLTSLLLNLQLVSADQRIPAETAATLQRAEVALKRMTHLLYHYDSQLLADHSENDQMLFSVAAAIQEVCVFLQQPNKNKIIRFHFNHSLPYLSGNKFLFQEALICLINNAFEAYPSTSGTKLVVISAAEVNHQLQIQVIDGGRGFNPATTQYRVSDKPAGQGIGWYVTRSIIEQEFNGHITVDSEPAHGTRISCSLPITHPESKASHRLNQ
jgi:signal transduction histidine kinase